MAHPVGGYKDNNGKKVPGVTTVIGRFKDSGGLLWWAFEQGKAAERGEINSLYDKRDQAADAGTLAHSMVENYINGLPDLDLSDYPEEIAKLAAQGFENYKEWAANNKIEIIYQEVPLVSDVYKFGGCLDGIGIDSKGRRCLIDWKSSAGIYRDYLLQLGAYQLLWDENKPKEKINGGAHICRFSKTDADFEHRYFNELSDAIEMFLLLKEAYAIDLKLKKRVK